MTYVVQIGNSDDKLGQREWSQFRGETGDLITGLLANRVYFAGYSLSNSMWQNACWVFDPKEGMDVEKLKGELRDVCRRYRQDAIALTVGETVMVLAVS